MALWTRSTLHATCRRNLTRSFATAVETPIASTSTPPPAVARAKKATRPSIRTAVILNRAPVITRTPTPFERAYYSYQQRVQRALHNPFPHEFYFKPGAPLETRFNIEEAQRDKRAFGKNFGADAKDAFTKPAGVPDAVEEVEELGPRWTKADEAGDVRSLDRQGQRNLYLLLLKKEGGKETWTVPSGEVEADELLHEAAERDLIAQCGTGMNTWVVSRNPIGVQKPAAVTPAPTDAFTFFYKAHIMAGQVQPDNTDVLDFAWLTKQEIEGKLSPDSWNAVKDILSDF